MQHSKHQPLRDLRHLNAQFIRLNDNVSQRHRRIIPILATATAGCLWGTGFFFGKIALTEMPVSTMVLFRFAFACIGLLPFIFVDRPRFGGGDWGWVLAASFFGVPVQQESSRTMCLLPADGELYVSLSKATTSRGRTIHVIQSGENG